MSPYCHLLVVSTQVFCWQVICAVLCQVMDLLVLMSIITGSRLLTSLFLSVMSLLINTCYYFDLCSMFCSLVFSHADISMSSSFRTINIFVKISVNECFGPPFWFWLSLPSFLQYSFALFPFSLKLPDIVHGPYYIPSLYSGSLRCMFSDGLLIPVIDQ